MDGPLSAATSKVPIESALKLELGGISAESLRTRGESACLFQCTLLRTKYVWF